LELVTPPSANGIPLLQNLGYGKGYAGQPIDMKVVVPSVDEVATCTQDARGRIHGHSQDNLDLRPFVSALYLPTLR
jgi:hypothetical protein